MIDTNEKMLIGYCSEGKEELHTVRDVANFICKYGRNEDVEITETDGTPFLDTFGIYINRIADMDYREKFMKVLVPMQLEVEKEAFSTSDNEMDDSVFGKPMHYPEFEQTLKELLSDVSPTDIHETDDFFCSQTDGFPTALCACFDKGIAWLKPNYDCSDDGETLDNADEDCAAFGIRPCHSKDDFNRILLELGDDAFYHGAITDEDIGMGGM